VVRGFIVRWVGGWGRGERRGERGRGSCYQREYAGLEVGIVVMFMVFIEGI
jgi:hypothetical protein